MKKANKNSELVIRGKVFNLPASMQGKGHYLSELERVVEQLDAMLSHHSKILVFRVDLRLYVGTENNEPISKFIRCYRKSVQRKGYKRLGYIWSREQETSEAQHYHCAFILNANQIQKPHEMIEVINRLWISRGHVKAFVPKNCYGVIKRGDMVAYQEQFKRLSYLAKVATKQLRPKLTNDYSSSRLKEKK